MKKMQFPIKIDFTSNNPVHLKEQLKDQLIPYVENIYQFLSKTGHFSRDLTTTIVKNFYGDLKKIKATENNQIQIIAMTLLMGNLLQKAEEYETYRFFQNRFLAFFNELFHQGYPALKEESLKYNTSFHQWYTNDLYVSIDEFGSDSPFGNLLATWLLCEERQAALVRNGEYLLKNFQEDHCFFAKKLASLLFLQANDGVKSLKTLKNIQSQLHHSELVDHFLLMEQKKDFVMMKHWFELFFPAKKPKYGTVLGRLYEDMLLATGSEDEKISIVWKNWLSQPNFSSYKTKINKASPIEKKIVLDYILASLEKNLFRANIESVYYQIITEEALLERGIHSLLIYKKEITTLSPELQLFLKVVLQRQPELILPFYHQLVERLVQKKSRNYYEEAVQYIKQLKLIYDQINKNEVFQVYLLGLKKRFKTFRAFIQELNKID